MVAADDLLAAEDGELAVEVGIVVGAGTHRDLDPGVGDVHFRRYPFDDAHRRGGEEQAAEILLRPQIDDLGLVYDPLGSALTEEFEIGDCALECGSEIALAGAALAGSLGVVLFLVGDDIAAAVEVLGVEDR